MKVAALLLLAGPAGAETLVCDLSPPCPAAACEEITTIRFSIDRTQFAPAIDPNEPPRRKVTLVEMHQSSFPAEALVMGDLRGFWAEAGGGGNVLFIVQPDGAARYAEEPSGFQMEGTCSG